MEAMSMAVSAGYPGYEQTEWARLQLGGLYEKYGKMEDAKAIYESALVFRPKYPFAMAALAGLEHKKDQFEQALAHYEEAAAVIPEIGFYIDMAKIYRKQGQTAKFEALIPEIETMFQEDMEAGHNMALEAARFQLELKGDAAKAFEVLQIEIKNRPDNMDVNRLLGEIQSKLDNQIAAKEAFQKAAATGSKDPELKRVMRI